MPSQYISGQNAQAFLSADIPLPITKWTATPASTEITFRNSATQPYQVSDMGFQVCRFVLEIEYDTANPPAGAPYSLYAGGTLSNVHLMPGADPSQFWIFPTAKILTTPISVGKSVDRVHLLVNCTSSGPFLAPSQTENS